MGPGPALVGHDVMFSDLSPLIGRCGQAHTCAAHAGKGVDPVLSVVDALGLDAEADPASLDVGLANVRSCISCHSDQVKLMHLQG